MPKAFVNGVSINYRVDGQGEPLLLIMGLAGSMQSWIFQKHVFRKHFRSPLIIGVLDGPTNQSDPTQCV